MLRLLIRDITVVKGPEQKRLRLHIRWQGGTTETVELHLAPNRAEAVRYHEAFVARFVPLQSRTMTMKSSRCSNATASQAQLVNPSRSA